MADETNFKRLQPKIAKMIRNIATSVISTTVRQFTDNLLAARFMPAESAGNLDKGIYSSTAMNRASYDSGCGQRIHSALLATRIFINLIDTLVTSTWW